MNDGSTDDSYRILLEYQRKYSNIILINQDNKGLSGARNAGLKAAKGKYIYFCDSDDWIHENVLEKLYVILEDENLEILHFEPKFVYDGIDDDGSEIENTEITDLYDQVLTGAQVLNAVVQKRIISPCVQYFIVRHDLILQNNIAFYEGILHEDHLYYFKIFMAAKRVKYIKDQLYYRRLRQGSITHSAPSAANINSHFVGYAVTFNEICSYFVEDGRQYRFIEGYLKILYNEIISLYIKTDRYDRDNNVELYGRMQKLLKESHYLHSVKIAVISRNTLLAKWIIGIYKHYRKIRNGNKK